MIEMRLLHDTDFDTLEDVINDSFIQSLSSLALQKLCTSPLRIAFVDTETGKIVALCGGVYVTSYTAEAWFVGTEHMKQHSLSIARKVCKVLEMGHKILDVGRVELIVDAEQPAAYRFAEFLGFTQDGFAADYYAKDKHAYRFVRYYDKG